MANISEKIVKELPVPATGHKVHWFSGASVQGKAAPAGFGIRVMNTGVKSFVFKHRTGGREGKQFLETLGRWEGSVGGGTLSVRDAIIEAGKVAKSLRHGDRQDPRPERTRRLEDADKPAGMLIGGAWQDGKNPEQKAPGLLDVYIERYVRKDAKGGAGLRSADMIAAAFERWVAPEIGNIGIYDIRRSHIVNMMDQIEAEDAPVMADRVLAYVRAGFNWYAAKRGDDEFRSPIVKGMARTSSKSRARTRILADDELRDLWSALDTISDPQCYPAYIKFLLLTATRRTEASRLHTSELDGDLFTIPGARYKTGIDHTIPLSEMARDLIGGKPRGANGNSWFVFSTTSGALPFSGFSKAKTALDDAIADIRAKAGREPMQPWVLHDLRRTARSLMSRAKVDADIAERVLGHVIPGVRATYDRYEYRAEKADALERLATLVGFILNPPKSNVVPLKENVAV